MAATHDELAEMNDIGALTANYIVHYFKDENNIKEIESLKEVGVKISAGKQQAEGLRLAGKKFVLTGTLPTLKRNEASELIENNGGEVMSSVSRTTDYVLAGDNAGSKLDKARALAIKILTEQEFLNMIEQ